jgi:hypothetical protein
VVGNFIEALEETEPDKAKAWEKLEGKKVRSFDLFGITD